MAPTVRIKRPKTPAALKKCKISFSEKQSQAIWVLAMVLLGTGDVLIQWWNFVHLSNSDLGRGLQMGPPPFLLIILLLTFTVVGTLLYVPETLNTLSVFRYGGQTKVHIVIEQVIVQVFEAIPLGAVNYYISRCRYFHATLTQTAWGSMTIVYTFTRLIWYAQLEGKKMVHKTEDEIQMKKGFFMLVCALFASAMAFPVMIWRSNTEFGDLRDRLEPVSIVLLRAPFLNDVKLKNYRLDGVLEQQGYDLSKPWLVKSLLDVYDTQPGTFTAKYHCDTNTTFSPPECLSSQGQLVFNFTYATKKVIKPLGEIQYNFAFIPYSADDSFGDNPVDFDKSLKPLEHPEYKLNMQNQTQCIPSSGDLSRDWRLTFYIINFPSSSSSSSSSNNKDSDTKEESSAVFVNSPWEGCTTPRPYYNPDGIPMC